jgi:hypothetical protein
MWAYWQRTLAKPLPLLNLQIDFKRPPVQQYAGAFHHFQMPPNILAYVARSLLPLCSL